MLACEVQQLKIVEEKFVTFSWKKELTSKIKCECKVVK